MPRPSNELDVYFAFGSNLNRAQMRHRCPQSRWAGWGFLDHHRLEYVGLSSKWGGGVATITPRRGDRVPGYLYYVSPSDLASLDRYEGVPRLYRRKVVTVRLGDGSGRVKAWAYHRTDGAVPRPPSPSYLRIIQDAQAEMLRQRR
jgi:gamma-glutamylcyclotransferase (GGCT)/AIG2-like uncharacterized protein YtfP